MYQNRYTITNNKRLFTNFFKNEKEQEPVRDFLKSLSVADRKSIGADIMAIEISWPIGYPKVRKLDTDLWEIRSNISDKRICRIFFTISENNMILLHAIIKKSNKTPKSDLELSKKRRNLIQNAR